MSEVSVDSSSISSAIKLCQEAQKQLRMTTLSIRKQVDGIRSSWNDKKCDEFVQITEKCSSSLIKPIEGLDECIAKLQEINNIIEEYNYPDGFSLDSASLIQHGDVVNLIGQGVARVTVSLMGGSCIGTTIPAAAGAFAQVAAPIVADVSCRLMEQVHNTYDTPADQFLREHPLRDENGDIV